MSRNLATTNMPVNGMDRIVRQSIQQLLPVLGAVTGSREALVFGIVHDFGDVRAQIVGFRFPRQTSSIGHLSHLGCDGPGNCSDFRQWRINPSLSEIGVRNVLRKRACGNQEHFISDVSCAARDDAQAYAREDVHVVPLCGHKVLWTVTGSNGLPLAKIARP